jgi:hypothetical protein
MFASGNPGNNRFWNGRVLTLGGYPISQQISLMNNGVLDKIEETPAEP